MKSPTIISFLEALATIFSCNKHPPPPLMIFNSGSHSSHPSIVTSICMQMRHASSIYVWMTYNSIKHHYLSSKRIYRIVDIKFRQLKTIWNDEVFSLERGWNADHAQFFIAHSLSCVDQSESGLETSIIIMYTLTNRQRLRIWHLLKCCKKSVSKNAFHSPCIL